MGLKYQCIVVFLVVTKLLTVDKTTKK